jgi:hypothetical protein
VVSTVETFKIWILNGNEGLELKFIHAHQLNQRQLDLQLKEKNITMLSCKSCEFFPVLLRKSFLAVARCFQFWSFIFPAFSQMFTIFPSVHHFP